MAKDSEAQKAYFKKWYAANREKVKARRNQQWKDDEAYRAKVLAQNASYRARQKALKSPADVEALLWALAKKAPRTVDPSIIDLPVEVNGEVRQEKFASIGAVAQLVGCSVQWLRLAEADGRVPPARRSGPNWRYYRLSEIQETVKVISEQFTGPPGGEHLPRPSAVRLASGEEVVLPLVRISEVANRIARSVVSLDSMEATGKLPATPLRWRGNHRLFTLEMVDAIEKAFDAHNGKPRGPAAWSKVYADIASAWTALGIDGAKVLAVGVAEVAKVEG